MIGYILGFYRDNGKRTWKLLLGFRELHAVLTIILQPFASGVGGGVHRMAYPEGPYMQLLGN